MALDTCFARRIAKVKALVSRMRIAENGDDIEKAYWPAINVGLPNYARFWQQFVVSITKRITAAAAAERIQLRDNV